MNWLSWRTKYPEQVTADSPTQRVGAPASRGFQSDQASTADAESHKATSELEFLEFHRRVIDQARVTAERIEYTVEPKFDGLPWRWSMSEALLLRVLLEGMEW